MSEIKKLSNEQLEEVSGGAGVTSCGFPYDNKGTVTFTDKTGAKLQISATDWKWLLDKYDGSNGNPERYLATVPAHDIEMMINDRHSPFK